MAVDNDAIVSAVSGLPLRGNEEGLIPGFGLYLTRHFAGFYNRVSYAYLHRAEATSVSAAQKARDALVEAGHICAFNTFGGIMLSQEWEAVVMPMIENREDWVRGIVGVVNALGWGVWTVSALVGGERLEVTIANSYESHGYLHDYGRRESGGVCLLAQGGVAGIMNLLYHGDITTRPALDTAYYQRLFSGSGRFIAREVACRASGASECRFVATRAEATP
jgi:hypothetical protein